MTWALDDAVAAYREASGATWLPCTWQQLEQEMRFAQAQRQRQQGDSAGGSSGGGGGSGATDGWQVQLRTTIAELRELWRQRLEVGYHLILQCVREGWWTGAAVKHSKCVHGTNIYTCSLAGLCTPRHGMQHRFRTSHCFLPSCANEA